MKEEDRRRTGIKRGQVTMKEDITDKKENKIFLIYKEIQRDRVPSHI